MQCNEGKARFQLKTESPICLRKMEADTARCLTAKFCIPPKSPNVGKRPKIVGRKVFWVERQTAAKFSVILPPATSHFQLNLHSFSSLYTAGCQSFGKVLLV